MSGHGGASDPVEVFDRHAERYRDRYGALTQYDEDYRAFAALLPPGPARVLDAACGPGNVAAFLLRQRPELQLLGIDLAPRMLEIARAALPQARFALHDCRRLRTLGERFDGIACAFALPYLSPAETLALIDDAAALIDADGPLYLSAIEGRPEDSRIVTAGSGERVHLQYHAGETLQAALEAAGFEALRLNRLPLSNAAASPGARNELAIIARRRPS